MASLIIWVFSTGQTISLYARKNIRSLKYKALWFANSIWIFGIYTTTRLKSGGPYRLLHKVGKGMMKKEVMAALNETHTTTSERNDEAYAPFPSSSRKRFYVLTELSRSCTRA
jgi:hypothetical protein